MPGADEAGNLAEAIFSRVLVSVQRVLGWTVLIWPLGQAPEPQCGFVLPAGRCCRSMGAPGSTWHPLYPSLVCHQAAGSGAEPSCGREGWPEPGICSQELHGFSHGFIGTFGAVSAGQLLRHGAAGSQAALTNEAHGGIHVGHCSDLV